MFSEEKICRLYNNLLRTLTIYYRKGVCKKLVTEDILKEQGLEELPSDYVLPTMSEEDCARRQAKRNRLYG